MREAAKRENGFTMVEVVVVLAMMTIVSGIVLVNFTGLNTVTALNRSARELALALRRSQNMSLAVRQLTVGDPPTLQIVPAVGIRLTRNQSSYTLFGDLADPAQDNLFSGDAERIGPDETLLRGVTVRSLTGYASGFTTTHTVAHVLFSAPEATMLLTDQNGASIGERLDIELTTSTGQTKKLILRTSGQISIQ